MIKEAEARIIETAISILEDRLRYGESFSEPAAVKEYFMLKLGEYEREVLACMFLDTRHRLLGYEELFFGTVDGAHVHQREVVRSALRLNAATLIVGHNHPSGCAEPSSADRVITKKLEEVLKTVDVRLLDHIVVGSGGGLSFAERGWL